MSCGDTAQDSPLLNYGLADRQLRSRPTGRMYEKGPRVEDGPLDDDRTWALNLFIDAARKSGITETQQVSYVPPQRWFRVGQHHSRNLGVLTRTPHDCPSRYLVQTLPEGYMTALHWDRPKEEHSFSFLICIDTAKCWKSQNALATLSVMRQASNYAQSRDFHARIE